MDYASLYPSSMIAENISHDSLLGFKEYQLDKDSKKKDDYILIKDTINKKYDNLEDYTYTDIEYDIYQGVGDEKKKIGYKVCRYSEKKTGEKSVLPRILMDLLKARKDEEKNDIKQLIVRYVKLVECIVKKIYLYFIELMEQV